MKKKFTNSILTALLLVLLMPLFGQKHTYIPMAVEGAHWLVGYSDSNMPPWEPTDYYQYVIRGDTILNDINYKKVLFRDITNVSPYLITYEFLAGLMRDDTANQKVYAINFNFPFLHYYCPVFEEFLLYDFGVNIGDTIDWCVGEPFQVSNISIEFLYGMDRMIINELSWGIEGIGTDFGVFEWGMGSKGFYYQLFNYCLGTDEECGCQWVGLGERLQIPAFKIFPNPVTGNTITLMPQIPVSEPVEVRLYDMTGKEIYRQCFENLSVKVTIQIPNFVFYSALPLLLRVGNDQDVFFKLLIINQ